MEFLPSHPDLRSVGYTNACGVVSATEGIFHFVCLFICLSANNFTLKVLFRSVPSLCPRSTCSCGEGAVELARCHKRMQKIFLENIKKIHHRYNRAVRISAEKGSQEKSRGGLIAKSLNTALD